VYVYGKGRYLYTLVVYWQINMIKEKVRAANKYSVSTLNDVRSHL